MPKRKRLLSCVAIAMTSLVVWAWLVFHSGSEQIGPESFHVIRIGMTEPDVRRTLGPPLDVDQPTTPIRDLEFLEEQGDTGGLGVLWTGQRYTINVVFIQDDNEEWRVRGLSLYGRRSLLSEATARLRAWLGY